LDALRGSETGATSVGIDPTRPRITAFALSAAIAGFGGALLASQQGEANPVHFSPFFGLFWVVLVVTFGARHIEGAILGAFALVLLPEALHALGIPAAFEFVLFGVGALAYARHPEGIVEAAITGALARLDRRIERTRAHSSRRTEQVPPLETSDQARTPASHLGDGA
jgi:ABC-type branched-subunit amino acid transport system permease subunit